MKRLLFKMLKKHTKTEKGRLEVLGILHDSMCYEYNEQTSYGNVYNANIEFIMSKPIITSLVVNNDIKGLKMIKSNLDESFDVALDIIARDLNDN